MSVIRVDIREASLFQKMQELVATVTSFKDLVLVSEVLPIGDIILGESSNERIVVERKSLADLLASIKDGRYDEQSFRLNGSPHHNHNIVYLIEGDMNTFRYRNASTKAQEKTMLYSSMFSLNYYKGFSVMRTMNDAETAWVLCNMANKMYKEEKLGVKFPFYSNTTTLSTEGEPPSATSLENTTTSSKEYADVVKKIKKENVTVDNIGQIVLSQIPDVGNVAAAAIMEKHGTLPDLIRAVEADPNCLTGVTYTNNKGQVRKIKCTSADNVAKYLLCKKEGWSSVL